MEEEESGNGRRVGKRERERKIVSCIGARCYPFSLCPSSLNANRGEIKKATGWPPANCPSQTWRTLRECSLREHNPRINPRKTSLSGFYEGRGKKATRTCVRVSPSRRANRSTSAFFRTSFFSSSFPSLPFSSRFFFLRISIMVERIFFAAPRCRSRLRSRFKKRAAENHHTAMKFYRRSIKSASDEKQTLTLALTPFPSPFFTNFITLSI